MYSETGMGTHHVHFLRSIKRATLITKTAAGTLSTTHTTHTTQLLLFFTTNAITILLFSTTVRTPTTTAATTVTGEVGTFLICS